MIESVAMGRRLLRVLTPTPLQAFTSITLAVIVLGIAQGSQILDHLGILPAAILMLQARLLNAVDFITHLPLVANVTLVAFWATVGLAAYLVCWALYSLMIEARNEVTLDTQYANGRHWIAALKAVGIKAVAGCFFIIYLVVFSALFGVWMNLSNAIFDQAGIGEIISLGLAVGGLTVQIYALIILLQLVLTPWYRPESEAFSR
jgi:hypothetical protein